MNKLLLILVFSFSGATAQEKSREKIIQVNGSSTLSSAPDIGILFVRLSEIHPVMTKAIEALGKKSDYYNGILTRLGFRKEDIKTTAFAVSVNRFYRKDQMVDSGFIASQNIKLEFTYGKDNLAKIMDKLSSAQKDTDFSFDFKLSDKLKAEIRSKLIEQAIKDATQKAELIASASAKKLIGLKGVSYGVANSQFPQMAERDMKYSMAAAPGEKSFTFTPEDILFQESIYMEWVFE